VKGRFILSTTVFLSTAVLADVVLYADTQRSDRPNILFIIADDMSWPHAADEKGFQEPLIHPDVRLLTDSVHLFFANMSFC